MKLEEAFEFIKFKYDNYKHNKRPRVRVLDNSYPGKAGDKTKGKTKDVLGWNINYFKNKKYAMQSIDDIGSFVDLLGEKDKKNQYDRINTMFPQQASLIRRYKKKHMKNIKQKIGNRWKKSKK